MPSVTSQPALRWSGWRPVPLPRVVPEDDVRAPAADPGGDLEALPGRRLRARRRASRETSRRPMHREHGRLLVAHCALWQRAPPDPGPGPMSLSSRRYIPAERPHSHWPPIWQAWPRSRTRCRPDGRRSRAPAPVAGGRDSPQWLQARKMRGAQQTGAAKSWSSWRSSGRSTSAANRRSRTIRHESPSLARLRRWRSKEPGP